jgi:hypothetical protein
MVYVAAIIYIFGHLVYFAVILVYFSRFGILYREKSGNPDFDSSKGHLASEDERHGQQADDDVEQLKGGEEEGRFLAHRVERLVRLQKT